jgi:hypothetical protein
MDLLVSIIPGKEKIYLNRGKASPLGKQEKLLALKSKLNSESDTLSFYESLAKFIDRNIHRLRHSKFDLTLVSAFILCATLCGLYIRYALVWSMDAY